MIRHIAMFKFNEHADEDSRAALIESMDMLAATIPQIVTMCHGADLGFREGNFDYGVVVDFASPEDYRAYSEDPVHREMIATRLRPIISERAAIQFRY